MLRMWKLLTVAAICGHAVVAADAPNIVQNDNLGVKMHGDSLEAHMKLPAGGVADSGDVANYGGLSWTRMKPSWLDYEGSVPESAKSGIHKSSFAGTWHCPGTNGGAGGAAKTLTWQMNESVDVDNRKLVINWKDHPGAKIVLNNGKCKDYFIGERIGNWPLFFGFDGYWRHYFKGKEIKMVDVGTKWTQYREINEYLGGKIGEHYITCAIRTDDNNKVYKDEYRFNFVEQKFAQNLSEENGPETVERPCGEILRLYPIFSGKEPDMSRGYKVEIHFKSENEIEWGREKKEINSSTSTTGLEQKYEVSQESSASAKACEVGIKTKINAISTTKINAEYTDMVQKEIQHSLRDSKKTTSEFTTNYEIKPGEILCIKAFFLVNKFKVRISEFVDDFPCDGFPDNDEVGNPMTRELVYDDSVIIPNTTSSAMSYKPEYVKIASNNLLINAENY